MSSRSQTSRFFSLYEENYLYQLQISVFCRFSAFLSCLFQFDLSRWLQKVKLQPWKLSDIVLVVEEERFHVHRAVLALWSPVFEKMFTSEFQEKSKNEVPLPDKKASEIEEMLLLIYSSSTGREITAENCYFLFKLAH